MQKTKVLEAKNIDGLNSTKTRISLEYHTKTNGATFYTIKTIRHLERGKTDEKTAFKEYAKEKEKIERY